MASVGGRTRSTEGVRRIERVIGATAEDGGQRCAAGCRAGSQPSPCEAERFADRVLGVATDGGE